MTTAPWIDHWSGRLKGDPLPWLVAAEEPAVRHRALAELLDRPADDRDVVEALARAMTSDPIAGMLAEQDPEGWWDWFKLGFPSGYIADIPKSWRRWARRVLRVIRDWRTPSTGC